MELNELKILWGKDDGESIDEDTLVRLVNTRSKNALERIRSRTRYENKLNMVLTVLFPILVYLDSGWIPSIIFFLVLLAMTLYYRNLYRKLGKIEFSSDTLTYTKNVYDAVKSFHRRYLVTIWVIFPFIIIGIPFLLKDGDMEWLYGLFLDKDRLIILLITLLISYLLIYVITYFLYGRYLKRIRKDYQELQEQ